MANKNRKRIHNVINVELIYSLLILLLFISFFLSTSSYLVYILPKRDFFYHSCESQNPCNNSG